MDMVSITYSSLLVKCYTGLDHMITFSVNTLHVLQS